MGTEGQASILAIIGLLMPKDNIIDIYLQKAL